MVISNIYVIYSSTGIFIPIKHLVKLLFLFNIFIYNLIVA